MTRRHLFIFTLLLVALNTQADERLHLSGFGTLGAAWFSNEETDFSPNIQPVGPGRSKTIDWGLDSRLGGQADTYSEVAPDKSGRLIPALALTQLVKA